jgi:hypothetical protein
MREKKLSAREGKGAGRQDHPEPRLPFAPIVSRNMVDVDIPGVMAEMSSMDAAQLGAFTEDALTEADAWESNVNTPAEHDHRTPEPEALPTPKVAKKAASHKRTSTSLSPRRAEKLIAAAVDIAEAHPVGDDIAFMHSILCQIGLPRSAVKGERFERRSGAAILVVRAGELFNGRDMIQQTIPYGPIPRLALSYMTTYAVRHRTPEIPFGDSVNEALELLGIEKSGQSYRMFRKQVSALAACHLTLGRNIGGKATTFKGEPVKQFEAWLADSEGQRTLWPSMLTLGTDFYETLIEHPIPHDLRALWALRGSSLAMDVYLFLAARLYRIKGKPVRLFWHQLRDQFGQEYQGKDADKDFKKKFRPALLHALTVYSQAKVDVIDGGVLLHPSAPAVPYRPAAQLRNS